MSSALEILITISVWVLFISGVFMILGPLVMGIVTKALIGTVNSVEDGKLWFYRHGLGFIIGAIFLAIAAYAASVL
jgi:hypothetical protein